MLNVINRLKVMAYLKSTNWLKDMPLENIAYHLDLLLRYDQLDAAEDLDGNLLYACGWWLLSDGALEGLKKGIIPKRINRGTNGVGIFFINGDLPAMAMRRVIQKNMIISKAHRFVTYTRNNKWLVTTSKQRTPTALIKKKQLAKACFDIIGRAA